MLPGVQTSELGAELWAEIFATEAASRAWKTDDEASAAAGVSARTLRTFQANKLIRSTKAPTGEPGGWRRMWSSDDVAIASVAGSMCTLLGWSIRKTAMALRIFTDKSRAMLIAHSKGEDAAAGDVVVAINQRESDWFLSVHDNLVVDLTVPDQETATVLGAMTNTFPFGMILDDAVLPIIYVLEHSEAALEGCIKEHGEEKAAALLICAKCARVVAANSELTSLVNISMPIRAAHARMRGFVVEHADDGARRYIFEHLRKFVEGSDA